MVWEAAVKEPLNPSKNRNPDPRKDLERGLGLLLRAPLREGRGFRVPLKGSSRVPLKVGV